MSSTPDIGKIIQLIMENPSLIEEISKLAGSEEQKEVQEASPTISLPEPTRAEESKTEPAIAAQMPQRAKRAQLLGALKPYVSSERAKAIDSMISVAEILDMMKAR